VRAPREYPSKRGQHDVYKISKKPLRKSNPSPRQPPNRSYEDEEDESYNAYATNASKFGERDTFV
jgi:hypothetical protein